MRTGVLLVIAALAVAACGDDGGDTNSPPTAADFDVTTNEDTPITRGIEATDVDGDELTVTLSAPAHGTAAVSGLSLTYTPAANYAGPDRITATISDGTNTVDVTINITVTAVDDAPSGVADAFACPEDTTLVISQASLVQNDTDIDSDTLSVTQVANVTNGVAMVNGLDVTFTPALNFSGVATFDYTVSDGTSSSVATVTITVGGANDAPNAVNDTAATNEDTAVDITNLLANDTDAENQTLSISSVQNATNGTATLTGNTVTFTPNANFNGTATFQYTVTDGAASDTAVVTVNVASVNDAPLAVDDNATTAEDTAVNVAAATVLANDSDVELSTLTVTAVGNAVNGSVALVGATITFTPNANFNGAGASFEYTVSDGTATDIGRVNVNVTAVNDRPVAVDDTKTTLEDTALVFPSTDLRANDTDVENSTLTVTAVSNPANGTVALSGGNITFTPAANFNGTASFDYTVSDGSLTDIGTVTVTVTAVNDAPVAVDDNASTTEDNAVVIAASTVLANDTDVDGPALSVTAVSNAVNGIVNLDGANITFTPAANFSGGASFDYTVSDGTLTDVGRVTITVTAVNDAPVAVDDTAATPEDTAATIAASTLLSNDTDADNATLTVTSVSNPTNGTVGLIGTTITFTPAENFNGTATFDYTVSDGTLTDVGTVTVTVIAVNDAPVAVDDGAVVQADNALVIPIATLLANDTDVDGPSLSIPVVLNPVNGTVAITGSSVTFTPDTGFSGPASFEYVVSDGSLTDVGLVSINVTAGPVCGDGAISAPETCDDGNSAGGDGCSATCQTENGFDCTGTPSTCSPICNDGIVIAGREACDDGNADNTDGCTTQCIVGAPCTAAQFPDGDRFAVDPATGHCYVSFDDDQTTFAAAQTACAGEGGYLATVTSATENAVLLGTINPAQNPWIGAVDDGNDTDDVFDWVTDEAFTFKNFAPGQPDDDAGVGGSGECLHIVNGGGLWNDTNCNIDTFVVGRICEIEPVACGDSVVQASEGEECDDSNAASGDGCSATCQLENGCGNGILDAGEECDDDNLVNGDTCSTTCQVLTGCGNGTIEAGEECDDDNVTGGDGCTATCQVEDGCGDGNLDPGEECDDDNLIGTDACSATCQLTEGCGDGNLDAGEQCDDDNTVGGDGCSATCQFERLVVFSFTGAAGNEVTFNADALVAGLSTIPVMSRGPGTLNNITTSNVFTGSGWNSAAFDANDYYEFTLTPDATHSITATQLQFDDQRSGTGPPTWVVRSSLDGFAADLGTAATHTALATNTVTLTGFANQTAPVTFRIFGFGASAVGGTWRIDNVRVNGFAPSL